jgi:hypothetical protein
MTVRKIINLFVVSVVGLMVCSCSEKKGGKQEIITTDYEAPAIQAPIPMPQAEVLSDVEWVEGRSYKVIVSRTPADSLSKVINNVGQEFIDNKVEITVKRQDGSVFYNNVFRKSNFYSWLDQDYRDNALLESINFVRTETDNLVFTVTINHPQASDDEAIYLELDISRLGELSISVCDENMREDLILQEGSEN